MTSSINITYDDDEFQRLKALKKAIGGSWEQVITEGIEDLAEKEGVEVAVDG